MSTARKATWFNRIQIPSWPSWPLRSRYKTPFPLSLNDLYISHLPPMSQRSYIFDIMRPQWPPIWIFPQKLCLSALSLILFIIHAMALYPQPPDVRACSRFLGHPLDRRACQAAVDNLPRGTLPSIFTTRRHTATNNYIQVPVRYHDTELTSSCVVTIDLDGHSLTDQFVSVPWDEIRKMAQVVVDICVSFLDRGGFITYGVGRALESLIHPTTYGINNAEIPTPAWVQQPDGTVEFIAIPSVSATTEYSKFHGTILNSRLAL